MAFGDEIGEALGARMVVVLIGERPGLTSPGQSGNLSDVGSAAGAHGSRRNCISNVRTEGISYELAAHKLHFLMSEARTRKLTGVELKDEYQLPADDTRRGLR